MTCRYDATTVTSSTTTATATHGAKLRNARPPTMRIMRSSCGAYATEDNGSLAKIGSARCLGRSCPSSFSVGRGSPMIQFFGDFSSAGGSPTSFVTADDTTPAGVRVKSGGSHARDLDEVSARVVEDRRGHRSHG